MGREKARRAHHGFRMRILVQDRSKVPQDVLDQYGTVQVEAIEDLMRKDAFLINSARGEIIDEAALVNALDRDQIGGAALDVFDGEPQINLNLKQPPIW